MDQNLDLFGEKKKTLEKEITENLFDAIEKNLIKLKDMRPIAGEILIDFEKINSMQEIPNFLEKLAKKRAFFQNLYLKYKAPVQGVKEKELIEKLSTYTQSLK